MAVSSSSSPAGAAPRREVAVYAVSALVFLGAAAITWYSNQSMVGGMAMPGGWTMSMAWMVMGAWFTSAAMFAGMWLAMMIAMMLPSTLPMVLLFRRAARFRGETRLARQTWIMACGYFAVWTAFGVVAYLVGIGIAQLAMRSEAFSRGIPVASGMALVVAGAYQLTAWKAACLKHCRDPLSLVAAHLHHGGFGALRLGMHHGAFCAACCWALMLIQLALGVMNILVMLAVALVIALEKLLPKGMLVARASGVLAIGAGLALVARALLP